MKIICSDYDGTFNYGGITPEKLLSVKRWRDGGNKLAIVSGRQKDFYFELKKNGVEFDYLVGCNGAVIVDNEYNTKAECACDKISANEIIEFLFSLGCPFAYVCCGESFDFANPSHPEEKRTVYNPENIISPFNQISTALDTDKQAADVTEKIRDKFGKFVNPLQNGRCIDIVPFGMDKAKGIYKLLEIVGGKYSDVIAVGDNINDEAMIKEFYSYAMANGVMSVKILADKITDGIEEIINEEI